MKTFKHSGTLGDIIYSLPIVKHRGGGEFYLHLNQIDWVVKHYYGGTPDPFHQGRMTQEDYEFMKDFMEAQSYITKFSVLDPAATEITDNLDRFRTLFTGHPGNYVDIYSQTFRVPQDQWATLRNTPWLSVPEAKTIEGKSYVINRSQRWLPPSPDPIWQQWREEGVIDSAVFVGLPQEHRAFEQAMGLTIDYYPTRNLLDLACIIAGAQHFIGNQSLGLSLAIGLGVPWGCEARQDLPAERNECYFPEHPQGSYF